MHGSFTDPAQSRSMNDISDTPSTDQVTVVFSISCVCVLLHVQLVRIRHTHTQSSQVILRLMVALMYNLYYCQQNP